LKAIVQDRYGPPQEVLELREVGRPEARGHHVLLRVRASSVNPADWHFVRGEPTIVRIQMGLRGPKHTVMGCDVAGTVEAAGEEVTAFRPGDEVFGSTFEDGFGGFAEFAAVRDRLLLPKPSNLSFAEAAAVPLAGMTALQGLRDHGRVEPGQNVLIVGASGGVGTFAVQIAKASGAEVTGVCSTGNVDLVRSLGADHVIDYTREDFTRGGPYDLVVQVAGTMSASGCRRALTPEGTLVLISGDSSGRRVGPLGRVVRAQASSPFVSQRVVSFTMKPNGADLRALTELIEAGRVKPVIGREHSLAEVPEAIRRVEEGHTRGKLVVTL
jgi:NADPH:quinone reductase-like Zn-dependent oxidoreductase